jgi:hypothetical protein
MAACPAHQVKIDGASVVKNFFDLFYLGMKILWYSTSSRNNTSFFIGAPKRAGPKLYREFHLGEVKTNSSCQFSLPSCV